MVDIRISKLLLIYYNTYNTIVFQATETLTILSTSSRGKYMPKLKQPRQQTEKSPPHVKPIDTTDSFDLTSKPRIRTVEKSDSANPHHASGKKIVSVTSSTSTGPAIVARAKIDSQKVDWQF